MVKKFIFTLIILAQTLVSISQSVVTLSAPETGQIENYAGSLVQFTKGYGFKATSTDWMHGFIDERISNLQNNFDVNSLSEIDINTNREVGQTNMQGSVNQNGSSQFIIPINIPASVNGLEPQLNIEYNSYSEDGFIGLGWYLSGNSKISIAPQNRYFDVVAKGYRLDGNDAFLLNGERILPVNGGLNSADGTEYRTESESFQRITSHGNISGMPESFEVETKQGHKYVYGSSSSYYNTTEIGFGGIFSVVEWYLKFVEDKNGNQIHYFYDQDNKDRISEIKYGINNASSALYSVKFEYIKKNNDFSHGGVNFMKKQDKLLLEIKGYIGKELYKRYKFQYQNNTAYQLNEVTESGSDGSSFNSQKFKYGKSVSATKLSGINQLGNVDLDGNIYPNDFNGDGITDLMITYPKNMEYWKVRYDYFKIYEGSTNGSFTEVKRVDLSPANYNYFYSSNEDNLVGAQSQITQDFNGDGLGDFMIINNTSFSQKYSLTNQSGQSHLKNINFQKIQNITFFINNGDNTFKEEIIHIDQNIAASKHGEGITIGDFNGDGATDVYLNLTNEDQKVVDHLGKITNASSYSFQSTGYFLFPILGNHILKTKYLSHPTAIDIEGDGKVDLYDQSNNTLSVVYDLDFHPSLVGVSFNIKNNNDPSGMPYRYYDNWYQPSVDHNKGASDPIYNEFFSGDFNGDDKSDLFAITRNSSSGDQVSMSLSNGINLNVSQNSQDFNSLSGVDLSEKLVQTGDFNGDGKTDLVFINKPSSSLLAYTTDLTILYSEGEFFGKKEVIPNVFINRGSWYVNDFNGDGFDDILTSTSLYLMNKGETPFYLTEALSGLGVLHQFTYSSYIGRPEPITGVINTNSNVYIKKLKKNIVTNYLVSSGHDILLNNNFEYGDIIYHRDGKGLLGLTAFNKIDNIRNTKHNFKFILESQYYKMVLKSTEVTKADDPTFKISEVIPNYTFDDFGINGGKRFYFTTDLITTNDFVKNLTTSESYKYTSEGNIKTATVTVGLIGKPWVETTKTEIEYKQENTWIPASKKTETLTRIRAGESPYVRTTEYPDYDTYGNSTRIINDPTSINKVEKILTYNSWGQILTEKNIGNNDIGSDVNSFTNTYTYDSKHRLENTINNSSQVFSNTYNDLNRLISIKDVTGLQTQFEYDGFGRSSKKKLPNGLDVSIKYLWSINNDDNSSISKISTKFKVISSGNGITTNEVYFDALEREKMKISYEENEDPLKTVKVYNNKGLVKFTSSPFTDENYAIITHNTYDYINRIIVSGKNGLVPTFYKYSKVPTGTEVKITTQKGVTKKIIDPSLKVILITDNRNSQLTNSYYSNGKIKNIQIKGGTQPNKITSEFQYDLQGNIKQVIDKNSGTTQYSHNSFGQLYNQIENNKVTNLTYDLLGRLKTNSKKEGITTYTYESSGISINQLKSVNSPGGLSIINEYGPDFGRLIKHTEIIANESFETSYSYNKTGSINTMTYPSGFEIKNSYSSTGELIGIMDVNTNKNLWEKISKNVYGQSTEYKLGNGKVSKNTYNIHGLPDNYKTSGILDMKFTFDSNTGNLTNRTDNIYGNSETFSYDDLDRLEGTTINNNATTLMTYEANGNIANKPLIGTYKYDNSKVNAVSEITAPVNTQPISIFTQDISYTSFNKVKEIANDNGKKIKIHYGFDETRRMSEKLVNNQITQTKYFQSNYEKIIKSTGEEIEINYVNSPAGTIAMVVNEKSAGNSQKTTDIYYSYLDFLGNPLVLTNSTGTVVLEQNFDAWGQKRNPVDLSYNNSPQNPEWLRGYTGHEHYDEFKLINMNGRVYDPIVGRFLSPDNTIQNVDNIQNHNRYSYVLNNPFKYTDPSGNNYSPGQPGRRYDGTGISYSRNLAPTVGHHPGQTYSNEFTQIQNGSSSFGTAATNNISIIKGQNTGAFSNAISTPAEMAQLIAQVNDGSTFIDKNGQVGVLLEFARPIQGGPTNINTPQLPTDRVLVKGGITIILNPMTGATLGTTHTRAVDFDSRGLLDGSNSGPANLTTGRIGLEIFRTFRSEGRISASGTENAAFLKFLNPNDKFNPNPAENYFIYPETNNYGVTKFKIGYIHDLAPQNTWGAGATLRGGFLLW